MDIVSRIAILGAGFVLATHAAPAQAVLVYHAGVGGADPTATRTVLSSNSSAGTYTGATIGDWVGQYGKFSATAIGPHAFLTAVHLGNPSSVVTLGGISYTITGSATDPSAPNSDLRVLFVNERIPTASIAPLYTTTDEFASSSTTAAIFGRGTPTGDVVTSTVNQQTIFNGWKTQPNGSLDGKLSYAIDTIDFTYTQDGKNFLGWYFTDDEGITSLSNGDSGGALFLKKNNQWLLAGIDYGISSPFSQNADGSAPFNATIVDGRGLYAPNNDGAYAPVLGTGDSVASRISLQSGWLAQYTPEPASLSLLALGGLGLLRRRSR